MRVRDVRPVHGGYLGRLRDGGFLVADSMSDKSCQRKKKENDTVSYNKVYETGTKDWQG